MNLTRSRPTTTAAAAAAAACLFSLFISFYILCLYTTDEAAFYGSIVVRLAGTFVLAALVVVSIRATIVTWITVLVLLTFTGKRRRFLVNEGKKITSDIVMYLFKVVLKERGLFAVGCATFISLMAWLS